MKKFKLLFTFLAAFALTLSSCEKKDPKLQNEEELITTLTYTLTPAAGGAAVEMKFVDLDGPGGNAPIISGGILMANTVYNATVKIWNESKTPAENITEEVKEEAEDHQFFYSSTLSDVVIGYEDTDKNAMPIGVETTVTTGNAGTGKLSVTLRHEPNKTAAGVSTGDISNAGGETDIEVTFEIDVQ